MDVTKPMEHDGTTKKDVLSRHAATPGRWASARNPGRALSLWVLPRGGEGVKRHCRATGIRWRGRRSRSDVLIGRMEGTGGCNSGFMFFTCAREEPRKGGRESGKQVKGMDILRTSLLIAPRTVIISENDHWKG
jgi:hypothetical protein